MKILFVLKGNTFNRQVFMFFVKMKQSQETELHSISKKIRTAFSVIPLTKTKVNIKIKLTVIFDRIETRI